MPIVFSSITQGEALPQNLLRVNNVLKLSYSRHPIERVVLDSYYMATKVETKGPKCPYRGIKGLGHRALRKQASARIWGHLNVAGGSFCLHVGRFASRANQPGCSALAAYSTSPRRRPAPLLVEEARSRGALIPYLDAQISPCRRVGLSQRGAVTPAGVATHREEH